MTADRSRSQAWRLDGCRALVVGGSRGIGLAAATELAAFGADVAIASRSPLEPGSRAALERLLGHEAVEIRADVADRRRDATPSSRLCAADWTAIDVLVLSAGHNIRKRTVAYDEAEYRLLNETNVTLGLRADAPVPSAPGRSRTRERRRGRFGGGARLGGDRARFTA